jgi:hypothetical protein
MSGMKLPSVSLLSSIVLASLVLTFADQASATIIVSDNFNALDNPVTGVRNANGQYSAGADASVWWFENTNGLSTSALSTPTATGNFSGNWIQINFANGGGPNNMAVSPFAGVSLLNVGDSISVQFDYRYVANPGTTDMSPKFGLFNGTAPTSDQAGLTSVVSGYSANSINGATDSVALAKATGAFFVGGDTSLGLANVGSVFDGTFTMNYKFELVRTGAAAMTVRIYLNDVLALTSIDSSATNFTFNEFAIRARGTAQIDNFVVVAVPEPATISAFALGLGVLAIACRRRK